MVRDRNESRVTYQMNLILETAFIRFRPAGEVLEKPTPEIIMGMDLGAACYCCGCGRGRCTCDTSTAEFSQGVHGYLKDFGCVDGVAEQFVHEPEVELGSVAVLL